MRPDAFAAAGLVGLLAGAHTATWGMYKDAPHEGFTWRKYARSIVLGALIGPGAAQAAGLDARGWAGAAVLFGLAYGASSALWWSSTRRSSVRRTSPSTRSRCSSTSSAGSW